MVVMRVLVTEEEHKVLPEVLSATWLFWTSHTNRPEVCIYRFYNEKLEVTNVKTAVIVVYGRKYQANKKVKT